MAKASTDPSAAARNWQIATAGLIVVLTWSALDPVLLPNPSVVLPAYVLLGFVSTAAFPRRAWLGILIAIVAALAIELLQSLVPMRDVRIEELFAKWLSAIGGALIQLAWVFLRQSRQR